MKKPQELTPANVGLPAVEPEGQEYELREVNNPAEERELLAAGWKLVESE